MKSKSDGMVYVFTGDGKGKTSAALGVGVRAALSGMNVAMVCWYKQADWPISEIDLPEKLESFEIFLMGKGFRIADEKYQLSNDMRKTAPLEGGGMVVDKMDEKSHKKAAQLALEKARELIDGVDVLILDEVNNAAADGLIDLAELLDLVSNRENTHVVITGRDVSDELVEVADLVTEMKKVKHPYDEGKKAVKGLDF